MSDSEILDKAVKKAIKSGWTPRVGLVAFRSDQDSNSRNVEYIPIDYRIEALIFNHEFSRALWGEETYADIYVDPADNELDITLVRFYWSDPERIELPLWKLRLMEMSISNDPIKYIGEHLND